MKNALTRISIPSSVVWTITNNELILMDQQSEMVYGTDEIGVVVWRGIASGKTQSEIVDSIAVDYDVDREEVEKDIAELADQLLQRNLLTST